MYWGHANGRKREVPGGVERRIVGGRLQKGKEGSQTESGEGEGDALTKGV